MESSILQDRNTEFSKLKGLDLQEVLAEIENTTLTYRDCLNLDSRLLFGLEIEWEGRNWALLREFLRDNMNGWILATDGSLDTGGEIKSPRLTDKRSSWQDLQMICDYLKQIAAVADEKTGGHIHFGANIFGDDLDSFLNFLKTYAIYENIFFRFYYGEFLRHRNTSYTRSQKIAWKIRKYLKEIETIDDLNDGHIILRNDRTQSINFQNLRFGDKSVNKNTLELRVPNGSIEEIIWQNNVNAFGKFILKTISDDIDRDYINQTFNNISEDSVNPLLYSEICLSKVLEFVDLIFDNDLDKFYFLRQYLRNYEENYGLEENKLAKRFIV